MSDKKRKKPEKPGTEEERQRPLRPEIESWIDEMYRVLRLPPRIHRKTPIPVTGTEPSKVSQKPTDTGPNLFSVGMAPKGKRRGAVRQRRSERTRSPSFDEVLAKADEIRRLVETEFAEDEDTRGEFETALKALMAYRDGDRSSETLARRAKDAMKMIDRVLHGEHFVDPNDPEAVRAAMKEVGYTWHEPANAAKSNVGLDLTVDTASGTFDDIAIADRPKAKHKGGSNGQHTTAFACYREVVCASVIGLPPDQAAENLRMTIGKLLLLPCISAPSDDLPVPAGLVARITELRDATSAGSRALGVAELAKEYLELRDAIPGASLYTRGEPQRTTGSGEPAHLASLRDAEQKLMKNLHAGKASVNQFVAADHERALLGLFDDSAMELIPAREQLHQWISFLMTAAQAYPATWNAEVTDITGTAMPDGLGMKLAREKLEGFRDEFPGFFDEVYDRIAMAAAMPKHLPADPKRPRPKDFAVEAEIKGGTISIRIKGRPASVKDGGAQGDHTSAEVLMKRAATGTLLPGGTHPVTASQMIARLDDVLREFSPERYAPFFQEPNTPANAPYQLRLSIMQEEHAELGALRDQIGRLPGDAPVPTHQITDALKRYMSLVDQRPTAVNYDAPARGRGEAKGLRAVVGFEAAGKAPIDRTADLKADEVGLMDELFGDPDGIWMSVARLIDGAAIQASLTRFTTKRTPLKISETLPAGTVRAEAEITASNGTVLVVQPMNVDTTALRGELTWDGTLAKAIDGTLEYSGTAFYRIGCYDGADASLASVYIGPRPVGEQRTAMMATAIDEFLAFLAKAFQETHRYLIGTLGVGGLRKAVAHMINNIDFAKQ